MPINTWVVTLCFSSKTKYFSKKINSAIQNMAYSKALLLGFLFAVSLLRSTDVSARMLAETTTTDKTQSVEESKHGGGYYGGGHYGGGHYGGGHYGGGHYGGGHYGGGHYGGGGHGGHWPPKADAETKEQNTEVVKPEYYGGGGGYGGYGHGHGGYGHGGYGGGGYGHGGYGHGGYGHGGYGHGGYGHGGYGGHWPPKDAKTTTTEEQKGN